MAQRRALRVTTTSADQRDIPPTPTFFPDYGQTSPEADVFKRDEDLSPLITPSSGGWTRVEQETKFTHHQELSPRSSQLAAATKRARFLPWSTPWHLMDARHIPAATNGFAVRSDWLSAVVILLTCMCSFAGAAACAWLADISCGFDTVQSC